MPVRGRPQRAQRAYAHLFYQRELTRWLAGQGLRAQIEKVLSDGTTRGGRTDLHVVVEGVRHSLEVQLSPISGVELRARTARYRQHVDHVWWLFGLGAEAAAAEYRANDRDALVLRLRQEDSDDAGTKQVMIGVESTVTEEVRWAPLAQCRLHADGLWTCTWKRPPGQLFKPLSSGPSRLSSGGCGRSRSAWTGMP